MTSESDGINEGLDEEFVGAGQEQFPLRIHFKMSAQGEWLSVMIW